MALLSMKLPAARPQRFLRCSFWVAVILAIATPGRGEQGKPDPQTVAGWDRYVDLTERRMETQLSNPTTFIQAGIKSLKKDDVYIRRLETKDEQGKSIEIAGGSIHHWLGAVIVPGKDLESVLRFVQDYDQHQQYFKDIEQSLLRKREGNTFEVFMRLRRSKMGVTARFNTEHRITYTRHANDRVSSKSVATRIRQLDRSGNEIPPGSDSGYLWRLNSYWRFSQIDGAVIVECESIGLSRPLGSFVSFLDFFAFGRIKKIAESIAREALSDTLTALRDGVLRSRDNGELALSSAALLRGAQPNRKRMTCSAGACLGRRRSRVNQMLQIAEPSKGLSFGSWVCYGTNFQPTIRSWRGMAIGLYTVNRTLDSMP
jgi:hypothetical protein